MRFAVDAHAIGCHLTGNEVYIRNLLNEFTRLDQGSEFLAYISKPEAASHLPERVAARWVSENPYKRLGWDLPRGLRRDRPDILHIQYTGPLYSAGVPLIATVHDVSYLECPQFFTKFRARQLSITVKRTLASVAAVLTPSEFSRRSILRHYPVDPAKVFVVPNAVSSHFRPVDREPAQKHLRNKFGLNRPFLLTVGDLQPRKNHQGLLTAFEQVLREYPKLPHDLVFVGKETWYSQELHQAVQRSSLANRVRFMGFVEDEDLVQFYGGCDLFVFPSFYEGFGLPILEAMACARAVACSNSTAMPEVANASGLLFDPHKPSEIAHAIRDTLLDPELRQRLERLGCQRAAGFSWEKAASQTLNVYYQVAGSPMRIETAAAAGVS